MRRTWKLPIILSGCVLGVALSVYVPQVVASRNSGGTYSLPSGNPVTSGTPISSSWANTTLSDLASEVTLSLDRNGRGAMLAPLQCSSGTVAAPSLTFSSDTDTGLYRIAANNPGIAAGGVKAQEWTTTGSTFPLALTTAAGLTATQSTTNGSAITATGNGTGHGVVGLGTGASAGSYTGFGVLGVGTTNKPGVGGVGGSGNSIGGSFVGNGTAQGVYGAGGSSGIGVDGVGGGTALGGRFASGTASTGASQQSAVQLTNGNLLFSGVDPNSNHPFTNTLTPLNIIKTWGVVSVTSGAGTLRAGFNISSTVTDAGSSFTIALITDIGVTWWAGMGNGYMNCGGSNLPLYIHGSSGVFTVSALDGTDITAGGCSGQFSFLGLGEQ